MLNCAVTLGFVLQSVCPEAHFCKNSRGKCSFWKSGSLLVKVLWKLLVLEAWILTFGEFLVENARFGSLDFHFGGKCSFWKLGFSLLVKVSWKKNARFQSWDSRFRVSSKSVLLRASIKSVQRECQAKSFQQVQQESRKSVLARVPGKM